MHLTCFLFFNFTLVCTVSFKISVDSADMVDMTEENAMEEVSVTLTDSGDKTETVLMDFS